MKEKVKQYLVLGLGRFGESLAKSLCQLGHEVLAVDSDQELVDAIAPYVTQAIQIDATDEGALQSLGVRNFDAAIVAIGQNMRDSILVCVLLKELGTLLIARPRMTCTPGCCARWAGSRDFSGARYGSGLRHLCDAHVLEMID